MYAVRVKLNPFQSWAPILLSRENGKLENGCIYLKEELNEQFENKGSLFFYHQTKCKIWFDYRALGVLLKLLQKKMKVRFFFITSWLCTKDSSD